MARLTDGKWSVMEVLWDGGGLHLGEILEALRPRTGWSRTTVHTYLTRMAAKGLVVADGGVPKRYAAAVSRAACVVSEQRRNVISRNVFMVLCGTFCVRQGEDSRYKYCDFLKKRQT